MKKKFLVLFALILSVSLLTGCAVDLVSTVLERSTRLEEAEPAEIPHFDDIEYVRPDLDEIYAVAAELCQDLNSPFTVKKINEGLVRFDRLCTQFDTMYAVANIRCCMNVSDSFYDEEYSWCMEADAEVQLLMEDVYTACANSMHSFWLERWYFYDGFNFYDDGTAQTELSSYDEYFDIIERQIQLLAEYRQIVNTATIEIDGQSFDFGEYVGQADYYKLDRAYELYYEKYNPVLGGIYLELIELRREHAELSYYDSYAELAYELDYGRDYSPEEAEIFMAYVKNYAQELARHIGDSGISDTLVYEEVDERELEIYLETVAESCDGRIYDAYRIMDEYDMYDLSMSRNKADTSFQTYLAEYQIPYLFLCPYGYTDDIMTLCHEFGHYADSYIRENAYESIDLAEVYSQTMQLVGCEVLDCVMTDSEYINFKVMNLLDMFLTLQYQTALAEFELMAYEMEEPTVENLNSLYMQLMEDYSLNEADYPENFYMSWIEIPHLFENPFYVISYPVSAVSALEIYDMELKEEGVGTEIFVTMSESMIGNLREATEYVGLGDPLSESSVCRSMEFLREQLGL